MFLVIWIGILTASFGSWDVLFTTGTNTLIQYEMEII